MHLSNKNATDRYQEGQVVETFITDIIKPSQIIADLGATYTGRLSLLDISWCFPEAEEKFGAFKIGDPILCIILQINESTRQIKLGQKITHQVYKTLSSKNIIIQGLSLPMSDDIQWERLERGDEFSCTIINQLNDTYLVKTTKGHYGLLHKSHQQPIYDEIKVKIYSKLDHCDLLRFVPANYEMEDLPNTGIKAMKEFSFIEEDLQSFYAFSRSLLGKNANDEQYEIIQNGFNADARIFSKEISTSFPLYIQFESNSPAFDLTFPQAIQFFFNNGVYSDETKRMLLDKLSLENYWFKISKRRNGKNNISKSEDQFEFSLYNEEINFHGIVQISKDKKEYLFRIKNFSFGHRFTVANEAKKRNTKYGSFLLVNKLRILSPLETVPFGSSQKEFFEFALLKTACFETVNNLKIDAGEILRHEGRTLEIMDKFLEYQLSLINEQKENAVFVETFDRTPAGVGNIAIEIPLSVANSLETEDGTTVNVRVKKSDDLHKVAEGLLSYQHDRCKIIFNGQVNIQLLTGGFYIDKKIPKAQLRIQREIIQDFLNKKIKIDHIESLLVNPDTIKTPILSNVKFKNDDLNRTEKEHSNNNQVVAVKKAVGNQNIFLIQGPPGTGKTTVISEIIQQLVAKGEKILVTGQNHVAVDNVLDKISEMYHLNALRVGNPDKINKELTGYTIDNLVEEYKSDYLSFIDNQLLLAKKILEQKRSQTADSVRSSAYTDEVNQLSSKYGKLKEVFKLRHFVLRDSLSNLSSEELHDSLAPLQSWLDSNKHEYATLLKPLIYNSVDVVFATCIGIKSDPVFRNTNFRFDTVIVDEAGKANIAETLVAIALGSKVILVGDQMQLPPYMDSSLIDEKDPGSFPKSAFGADFSQEEIIHALKTSFFEFIINRIKAGSFPEENKEMLNFQHRMHPHIGEFVSQAFYSGMVQMGSRTHLNKMELPSPFDKQVIFFDTSNTKNPYEQNDGYSARNDTEADLISEIILPKLFEHNISTSQMAIIAPYKSQVANIQQHIQKSSLCHFKNIDVSTLDSFQGKEYDIIIFSFTRSSDHRKPAVINGKKKYTKVGFLDDARRLNVAFSRAKKKLILVGNSISLTNRLSHYDGLFDYTSLFKKLIALSKKEDIGNFVNHWDDKVSNNASYHNFQKNYVVDDIIYGVADNCIISKTTGKKAGLVIKVGQFQALALCYWNNHRLNPAFDKYSMGDKIAVRIVSIDTSAKNIIVEILDHPWYKETRDLKISQKHRAKVIKILTHGYLLRTLSGIQGLLPLKNSQRKRYKESELIEVTIHEIDRKNKRIKFKLD